MKPLTTPTGQAIPGHTYTLAELETLFQQIRKRVLGMWAAPSAVETAALMIHSCNGPENAIAKAAEMLDPELQTGFWREVHSFLVNAR